MADLNQINRVLQIKRYEHARLTAMAQAQSREIRIMELDEEKARCQFDLEAQHKLVKEAEANIEQQKIEIEKEKVAASTAAK